MASKLFLRANDTAHMQDLPRNNAELVTLMLWHLCNPAPGLLARLLQQTLTA